jgi:hypothetical protein
MKNLPKWSLITIAILSFFYYFFLPKYEFGFNVKGEYSFVRCNRINGKCDSCKIDYGAPGINCEWENYTK